MTIVAAGAGQGRAGQGRAGQGRAGQGRAGQGRELLHIASKHTYCILFMAPIIYLHAEQPLCRS
jgi:hypothetical protein